MMNATSKATRRASIVLAAEALVAHWKTLGTPGSGWQHRGHWYPIGSERFAKALINAVRRRK